MFHQPGVRLGAGRFAKVGVHVCPCLHVAGQDLANRLKALADSWDPDGNASNNVLDITRTIPGTVAQPRTPFVVAANGPRTMALAARYESGEELERRARGFRTQARVSFVFRARTLLVHH